MDQQHPITPPPEVKQHLVDGPGTWREKIVNAYCAGADAKLEACCDWVANACPLGTAKNLRAARRPKPPSLASVAEQAQRILVENSRTFGGRVEFDLEDVVTIHRALKRLQELEQENHQ